MLSSPSDCSPRPQRQPALRAGDPALASDSETNGGLKLAAAALDNAGLIIVHRQAASETAETLAGVGGTEEAREHTLQVLDGTGRYGHGESGQRNRRLFDRDNAHPHAIRELRTLQAMLIHARPWHRVRYVRIEPPQRRLETQMTP